MKKAVLIATPIDFQHDLDLFDETVPVSPPLGILAIGSYLAAHGAPVELIDVQMDFGFSLEKRGRQVLLRRVVDHLAAQAGEIAWIGISQLSTSETGVTLANLARAALPETPILFGGYFATCNHRRLLEEHPAISAVVCGDGEAAALAISRALDEGRPLFSEAIPGLAWRDGSQIRAAPQQPMDLTTLPILDFGLLRRPTSYPYLDLMTSRGCPYACSYCLEARMRPYSRYPLAWVETQLKSLEASLPNDYINFFDPIFGVGKKQTLEICQVLRERRFRYIIESRADVLDPALIPALAEAHIEMIYLGIESASPATLIRMNKVASPERARAYLESSLKLMQACFENDITPVIGLMPGFPGDTHADHAATLEFIRRIRETCDEAAARTGKQPGYSLLPSPTVVHAGSTLAERLADFPDVVLRPGSFTGTDIVAQVSSEMNEESAAGFIEELLSLDGWTEKSGERLHRHMFYPLKTLLDAHPEWTDAEGVSRIGGAERQEVRE